MINGERYKQPTFWLLTYWSATKKNSIQSVNDVPGAGEYKKTEVNGEAVADKNVSEPPKIAFTVAETEINYAVGLNQWNGTYYDREDTFQTIMNRKQTFHISN